MNTILKLHERNSIPVASSPRTFRFGDVAVKSQGLIEVAFETPSAIPNIIVLMYMVPVNVPALLGLDVLDAESLYADNEPNLLVHRRVISRSSDNLSVEVIWSVPLL